MPSMSRRGNGYDNALMEGFFNTLKLELGQRFDSAPDAKLELFDFIEASYKWRANTHIDRNAPFT